MLLLPVPSSTQSISLQKISFRLKELYNPKAFFTHAAWLDQAFAHCPKFPTAASRRSLGRVSVPVWRIILSDPLRIVALVEPLPHQLANPTSAARNCARFLRIPRFPPQGVCGISVTFATLSPTNTARSDALLTRSPLVSGAEAPCYRSTCMCKACRQRSI